jgi:nucleoside-diphosphate-sugar epimerase
LPLREETTSLHLSTPYQITKSLGELYCNFFHEHHGLAVVKPRFFNSYGPGELPGEYRNVIPNFIYWAMKGEPLPITGTGEETRDFTFVGDIVRGLLLAGKAEAAIGREFNLASGKETRIGDLARRVNEAVGNTAGLTTLERRRWDTKPRLVAAIDRAREVLDWEPQVGLEQGLAETVRWFRENWSRVEAAARFGPGTSSAVRGISR